MNKIFIGATKKVKAFNSDAMDKYQKEAFIEYVDILPRALNGWSNQIKSPNTKNLLDIYWTLDALNKDIAQYKKRIKAEILDKSGTK